MFNKGDIVRSNKTIFEYEVEEDDPTKSIVVCKALYNYFQYYIKKGEIFFIDRGSLELVSAISPCTNPRYAPSIGDKVYLAGPEIPNGRYGFNDEMRKMLDDGQIYEISAVYVDWVNIKGSIYSWLYDYLQPAIISQNIPILSTNSAIDEPINEEADPFGLIAQRKALRNFIGE